MGAGGKKKVLKKKGSEPEDITAMLLPPPDTAVKAKLRQLIVAGFIDRVARLKPIGDMPHHPTRGAAYIPCRQADGTEVEGDTGVAAGGARLVWLHRGSALHSTRTDDPPEWIVYQEAMEGRSRGGDGRAEKRYLKQITALQPEWLAQLACADGGGVATTPLCRLSAPLPEPAPHYATDLDAVVCYVRPSFGFGGTAWPLPPHPCVMNAATAGGREPGAASEYAIFGRALLEGNVLDGMSPLQKFWVGQPALMVRPNGEQDTKVRELVNALRKAKVGRKVELIKQLKEDPRFLLPALQRCVHILLFCPVLLRLVPTPFACVCCAQVDGPGEARADVRGVAGGRCQERAAESNSGCLVVLNPHVIQFIPFATIPSRSSHCCGLDPGSRARSTRRGLPPPTAFSSRSCRAHQ